MSDTKQPTCEICGEPMPPGEEMFKFHGYSGPCPKPAMPQPKTRKSGEWIPVGESLPTHNYSVLAYITKGRLILGDPMIDVVAYIEDGKGWVQSIDGEDEPITVTHWMQLPEAPTNV